MFVEIHMIQNFGPSCLNRDDTNTPKDCIFGGFRRARISSQCLKSAIRDYFKTQISEFKGKMGVRTRLLPKKLIDVLVQNKKDEEMATKIVKKVLEKFGFKTDKKDDKKTEVLLFLNHDTSDKIAEFILKNWDSLIGDKIPKETENNIEGLFNDVKEEYDPDIALFGRMVASKTDLNVDAACYMAHAISTHKVDMEMDFFTAIDDLQEQEEQGAGMMGMILYNSSCFYRYSVLSIDQLRQNIQNNTDYTISVIKAFIDANINAIPSGKQTSMAAFSKPDFILVTCRLDQPWSLVNAFAQPAPITMKNGDIITQSITSLDSYLRNMVELYGKSDNLVLNYCYTGDREVSYLKSIGEQHKSIKTLIEKIGELINGRYSTSS